MQLAFIGGLGMPELIVILIIALLIFGRRLPEVMRNLGKSVTEFKRGVNDINDPAPPDPDDEAGDEEEEKQDSTPEAKKNIG